MDLRTARFLKKVTQDELEARAAVFQSRISDSERSLLILRPDEKRRIEKALNLKGCIQWNEKQWNMREEPSWQK